MPFILTLLLHSSSDNRTKNYLDHIPSNICLPFHTYPFGTQSYLNVFTSLTILVSSDNTEKENFMQDTLTGKKLDKHEL